MRSGCDSESFSVTATNDIDTWGKASVVLLSLKMPGSLG
jgi:hypothetical protein